MTAIEPFKTKGQIARERTQAEMIELLEETLERARRGELSGVAIAIAVAENQRPESKWRGWSAAALGNAIACMAQRYFNASAGKS